MVSVLPPVSTGDDSPDIAAEAAAAAEAGTDSSSSSSPSAHLQLVPVDDFDVTPASAVALGGDGSGSAALPDISYQALYRQNQSHFQTRLQFERLQTKRQLQQLANSRDQKRQEAQVRDDARMLLQSSLSGPATINTPFRASVGGRPATMPGRGPSGTLAVLPDYLDPELDASTQRGRVLANLHKALAHGVLTLSGQKLEAVPRSVFNTFAVQTGCVKSVNLSKNALNSVPREIQYFCNTTHLNLSYNQLEELPEELGKLAALRVLRLQSNRLWRLPRALHRCAQLEILDVSNNALASLPANVACNMAALKELYVQSNRLVQLPGSVASLKSLERLDASGNELMTLALCPVVQNIWDGDGSGGGDGAAASYNEGVLGNRDWMKFIHPETGVASYVCRRRRRRRRPRARSL
jgi:hypothetical protein